MRKILIAAILIFGTGLAGAGILIPAGSGSSSGGLNGATSSVTNWTEVDAYVTVVATATAPGAHPPNFAAGPGDWKLMTWGERIDTVGEMSSSSFTATYAGKYEACLSLTMVGDIAVIGGSDRFYAGISRNGTYAYTDPNFRYVTELQYTSGNSAPNSLGFCTDFSLSAGDTLEPLFAGESSTNMVIHRGGSGTAANRFTVKRTQ